MKLIFVLIVILTYGVISFLAALGAANLYGFAGDIILMPIIISFGVFIGFALFSIINNP